MRLQDFTYTLINGGELSVICWFVAICSILLLFVVVYCVSQAFSVGYEVVEDWEDAEYCVCNDSVSNKPLYVVKDVPDDAK